jgi:hypothetical protein
MGNNKKGKKSVGLRTRKVKTFDDWNVNVKQIGKVYTAKHKLEKTWIPEEDRGSLFGLPFGKKIKEIKHTPTKKKIKNIIKRKVKKLFGKFKVE